MIETNKKQKTCKYFPNITLKVLKYCHVYGGLGDESNGF
jgi:hypothetical protein